MTTKTQDERLTDGDHNGQGIVNDSYSKSASARPQINTSYDTRSETKSNPKDTSDEKSSSGKMAKSNGNPDEHSDAARKSKIKSKA
ncbi:hypothetical protein [Asticcacaulis endophyticus]|uniref:Uncharacterized protein n=1 Tax=Asticcacaulis endophyticus TaxID=1395890 RepID=A0A918UWC8_9CAUL|nr:hypothetical protein [Asticcacaulis endophyticus]GGZ37930.1 hypothetical protein GCM10011273_25530 [Asticcacaulis endophyticus]